MSEYVSARTLSGDGAANSTLNTCPSGTAVEVTTSTATEPVPEPRVCVAFVASARVKPETFGSGRTATTFLGRMSPPRGVRETAIAFSDG